VTNQADCFLALSISDCPLLNLAQEMSPLDEQFRKRLERLFLAWQEGVATLLRKVQSQGTVRRDPQIASNSNFSKNQIFRERMREMKRRELLRQTAALGLVAAAPFRSELGVSDKAPTTPNPLKPPVQGSIPLAVLLSQGAAVIDFCGPWEVFQDVTIPGHPDQGFQLYTVAESLDPIQISGGMKITPNYTLQTAPPAKVVVIPAQEEDRAIPGHWEGDLLAGGKNSYIATLVERHSRFLMLVKVPSKDTAVVVAALSERVRKLPTTLRRSLTWDRGLEMAKHKEFTVATDVQVYFCDPQSPWQRGSNENTNLLLRQYFPRGTDLSPITQAQLDQVSLRLNQRPRKTLGFQTPADKLQASVASTI
jgi:Integrase core domain/Tetracyclin repressor-like, C-terminal domain